ncbi:spermatogenesis-associated protein 22-like isoform X2 [Physella acuta]|nr:spermatogenesis-associated protein 22-like isoform X2 [Physella acuta]XP_059139059.1 spermatogenesis-associated protein 22-like isoform X2 [Physella acuta]
MSLDGNFSNKLATSNEKQNITRQNSNIGQGKKDTKGIQLSTTNKNVKVNSTPVGRSLSTFNSYGNVPSHSSTNQGTSNTSFNFQSTGNRKTTFSNMQSLEDRNSIYNQGNYNRQARGASVVGARNNVNNQNERMTISKTAHNKLSMNKGNQKNDQVLQMGDDSSFTMNKSVDDFQTKKNTKPKIENKKPAPDTSMRIFTCAISVLKSWTSSKISTGLVMFEVYGVVDSATLKDKSGTGKEFMLRDDTSSIKCIFYEIDRQLPRLIRGQVYRVVGMVNPKTETLKVVSVRLAEKDERQICQVASETSQREMDNLARLHSEP